MSEFDLSARITADASGLVQGAAQGEAAIEGLDRAQRDAAAGSKALGDATAATARAQGEAARGERDLAAAQERGASATEDATQETLAQVLARQRAAKAAADTAAAEARLATAQNQTERSAAAAALASLKLQQAQERASGGTSALDRDLAQLRAQLDPVGEAQRRYAQAVDLADTALARGIITQTQYEGHLANLRREQDGTAGSSKNAEAAANRLQFAYKNLGFQVQDVGAQLSTVSGPEGLFRIFAQQGGQIFSALGEIAEAGASASGGIRQTGAATEEAGADLDGLGEQAVGVAEKVENTGTRFGKFAAFMAGPWGAAILVGVTVLGPLIGKLFEAEDAADESRKALEAAATAADSYGAAQSLLGRIIDLTTGKLKTQNAVLVQAIKLTAQLNLQEAQRRIDEAGDPKSITLRPNSGAPGTMGLPGGNIDAAVAASRRRAAEQAFLDRATQDLAGAVGNDGLAARDSKAYSRAVGSELDRIVTQLDRVARGGKIAGQSIVDIKTELIKLASAGTDKAAALEVIQAITTGKVSDDLTPYARDKKPRKTREKKPPSTEARDEFGRDAADKIAGIVAQFDDAPAVLDKTNAKVRELDDIIEDLGRRKPPNFKDLIAQAEAAKTIVREGLIREVAKAYEQPKTLAEKAAVSVRQLDAVIADLADKKPPNFEKLIADAKVAQDVVRNGLQRPFADYVKEQENSLAVQRLLAAGRVDEANALRVVQQLQTTMGPLTREQKDAVLATTIAIREQGRAIDDARARNVKYVEALGGIKRTIEEATQAFVRGDLGQFIKTPGKLLEVFQTLQGRRLFERVFGDLFRQLEDEANGTTTVRDASDRMAAAVDKASRSIIRLGDAASSAANGLTGQPGTDSTPSTDDGEEIVVSGRKPVFDRSIGGIAEKIAQGFTSDENAKRFGDKVGKISGKAFGGAATGSFISGISNGLGIKMNSTGAQIGGAIGSFLPIPGGEIIGSIAGGLLGNLVKGPTRSGYAEIKTGATGLNTSSISGGKNSAGRQTEAVGYAGDAISALQRVAQALGGTVAANRGFGTIGTQGDKFVYDRDGSGSAAGVKVDSLEEAIRAFLIDAVGGGAVEGISEAMRKALASSADIDTAISEALKVKQIEEAIGGLGASLKAAFTAFDQAAADRVRIAKQYGLDVLAVEKLNGEARTKLVDDTLKTRIGSLSDFLDSLKFGDLFEGSANDRRDALNREIAKVQADAEAGVEGAASKLAQLLQQRIETTRDAYGTAGGEFTADRSGAISAVERVIQMERQRVEEASGGTSTAAAIKKGNDLANEQVNLTARLISEVKAIPRELASLIGSGSVVNADFPAVARVGSQ